MKKFVTIVNLIVTLLIILSGVTLGILFFVPQSEAIKNTWCIVCLSFFGLSIYKAVWLQWQSYIPIRFIFFSNPDL